MVSLKEIAEEAGVSQMTVSRVLNRGQASESVVKRVHDAIRRRGYIPKSGKRVSAASKPAANGVLYFLVPSPDHVPPGLADGERFSGRYGMLRTVAEKYGAEIRLVPVSRNNHPMLIEWQWLKHLKAGDPVIAESHWNIVPAAELVHRGCRVAALMRDLFWRRIFAPQYKKMELFTLNCFAGYGKLVNYLQGQGRRRIAITLNEAYMEEPEYPPALSYEQTMNLNGNPYRNAFPVSQNDPDAVLTAVRRAYERNPFDALIFSRPMPMKFDYRCSLAVNLGLPPEVEAVAADFHPDYSKFTPPAVALEDVTGKMLSDMADILLSEKFAPGEHFYESSLVNVPDPVDGKEILWKTRRKNKAGRD